MKNYLLKIITILFLVFANLTIAHDNYDCTSDETTASTSECCKNHPNATGC